MKRATVTAKSKAVAVAVFQKFADKIRRMCSSSFPDTRQETGKRI